MTSNPTKWTEAQTEGLKTLHGEKVSYGAIALEMNRRFGMSLSKSAIAGKFKRLGLRRKPEVCPEQAAANKKARSAAYKRRRRQMAIGPQVQAINRKPQERQPIFECADAGVVPLRTGMAQIGFGHCRYPYDATPTERSQDGLSTRYCGHQVLGIGSWCPAHLRLVTGQGTLSERAAAHIGRAA